MTILNIIICIFNIDDLQPTHTSFVIDMPWCFWDSVLQFVDHEMNLKFFKSYVLIQVVFTELELYFCATRLLKNILNFVKTTKRRRLIDKWSIMGTVVGSLA